MTVVGPTSTAWKYLHLGICIQLVLVPNDVFIEPLR